MLAPPLVLVDGFGKVWGASLFEHGRFPYAVVTVVRASLVQRGIQCSKLITSWFGLMAGF